MPTKTKRALAKAQKAPQTKRASLAAVIKAELSKPVVPVLWPATAMTARFPRNAALAGDAARSGEITTPATTSAGRNRRTVRLTFPPREIRRRTLGSHHEISTEVTAPPSGMRPNRVLFWPPPYRRGEPMWATRGEEK